MYNNIFKSLVNLSLNRKDSSFIKISYVFKLTLLVITAFSFISCATIKRQLNSESYYKLFKSGLDYYPVVRIFFWEDKTNNKSWFEIHSEIIHTFIIKGEPVKVDENTIELYIEHIYMFGNWSHGWTEAEYEASGKILLKKEDVYWTLELLDTLEFWDIKEGAVRYYDVIYDKDNGLYKVKNKIDRITETVKFLKTLGLDDYYGNFYFYTPSAKPFKRAIKKVLFPELTGYLPELIKKDKLSPCYDITSDFDPKFVMGDELLWSSEFTERFFPENLKELRNSGTLYRDFEESGKIMNSFYNLDYFLENILPDAKLHDVPFYQKINKSDKENIRDNKE